MLTAASNAALKHLTNRFNTVCCSECCAQATGNNGQSTSNLDSRSGGGSGNNSDNGDDANKLLVFRAKPVCVGRPVCGGAEGGDRGKSDLMVTCCASGAHGTWEKELSWRTLANSPPPFVVVAAALSARTATDPLVL